MKKLLITVLILFSCTITNAEITSKEERFSLLCEAEKSTGFRWENNDWAKKNWTLERYIITKQDYELSSDTDEAEHFMCAYNRQGSFVNTRSSTLYMDSCYMIKKVGEEDDELNYKTCREAWMNESPYALEKVMCKDETDVNGIVFKPNGWFTKYHIAGQVANIPKPVMYQEQVVVKEGVKDDMSIYVGRCSTL